MISQLRLSLQLATVILTEDTDMVDVFISYARQDKEFALAIARLIEQHEKTVWWDDKIPPGKNFGECIDERLQSAKNIVVIWSQKSVTSRWVREEAEEGATRGNLVPILKHDVEVPRGFRNFHTIDFVDWDGETPTQATSQLLDALSNREAIEYRHSARNAADLICRNNAIRNTGLMVFACAMFFLYAGWDFLEADGGAYINRVRLAVVGGISFMAWATWFLRGPKRGPWIMCIAVIWLSIGAIVVNYQYGHPEMGLAKSNAPLNLGMVFAWGVGVGVISAVPAAVAIVASIVIYVVTLRFVTDATPFFIASSAINLFVLGAGLVTTKVLR